MSEKVIPVLIADDDAGMRLILSRRISKTPGFAVCGMAQNGQQALEMAQILRPRVIFLDVDMPVIDGLACAHQLQDEDPTRVIIFATGHEEYREDAFEVYAFDYLVKPFDLERLDRTLQRILNIMHAVPAPCAAVVPAEVSHAPRLMLHHRDGVVFLSPEQIILIQREERSTVYYTENGGRYVTGENLSEAEERLDPQLFCRCHKSYIINISRIRSITPYGRWTFAVTLNGTTRDALITKEKFEELEKRFG